MHEFVPKHTTVPPTIGCLEAINASLWCVVADATVGRGWRGGSGDDPNDDFTRALAFSDGSGVIDIVGRSGVVCAVGGSWMSHVWQTPDGIVLLSYYLEEGLDEDSVEMWSAMASRAVDLAAIKSQHCGSFEVTSGCLVLMLPYKPGDYGEAEIAKAVKSMTVLHSEDKDQVLVPMPNGRYEVWEDLLDGEREDDVGDFVARLRVVRSAE